MSTLYRKYRPQTFSNLFDQEVIVQTITNEIISGKIAHAYLFSGSRGIGKTTVARLLAKAINCEKRKKTSAEPCGDCSSCTEITAGHSIDVIEIDAASQTGVDNVRENIIENAQFKPTKSPYKVFIVDEVHMLSPSAFNALLKTLEEPPAHVIFILATTELGKLPATVISRCERFNFKKISYDKMQECLQKICHEEKIKVADDVLDRVIAKSDGGLRDAESLLGQLFSLGTKEITAADAQIMLPSSTNETIITFVEHLVTNETKEAFTVLDAIVEEGSSLDQFAYDLLEMLRLLLVIQATNETSRGTDYNEKILKRIKKCAAAITPSQLIRLVDLALKRRTEIKLSPLPQLPLELLIVGSKDIFLNPSEPAVTTVNTTKPLRVEKTNTPAPLLTAAKPITGITATIKNALAHMVHDGPLETTFEQIKTEWPKIVEAIGQRNHALTFILRMCSPEKIDDNKLVLVIPYSFHKEKIDEHKNRQIIEECLETQFSEKIRIICTVTQKEETAPASTDLTSLAMEFGGEVMNWITALIYLCVFDTFFLWARWRFSHH